MDMSLQEASSQMIKADIRRVVLEKCGEPIGIVSDTALFQTVQEFGWGSDA